MKTSNKILIATVIGLVLGLFLHNYILRGAYQKAMANPVARYVKIPLKTVKYLNINHHYNITFKQGKIFQIQLESKYKNELKYNYNGDSLNLDARNTGELIIILPKLPIMKFNCDKGSELVVYISKSLFSSDIDAIFLKPCNFIIDGNKAENVNIKSIEKLKVQIIASEIKNLKVDLPKHSELQVSYSNISNKVLNLADSCSVNITGNYESSF